MKALHPKSLARLAIAAVKGWTDDKATSMGAALAFYSLISLAPLLIMVIAIAGLFLGHDRAEEVLFTEVGGLLGEQGAQGIRTILQSVNTQRDGLLAAVIGGITLLLGATTVFAELKSDLDHIWKVAAQKTEGVWGFIRTRLLSFGMVMSIAFLLLVSLVVSAAIGAMGEALFGGMAAALHIGEFLVSVLVMTALFAMMYKLLPAAKIPWSDVWAGAFVTALLFWIGKFAIGLYLGKSDVVSSFGQAGTLVLVILWIYYSSQIFFLGAEFTRAYAASHGSRRKGRDRTLEAANVEFEPEIVRRARHIVKGDDPVLRRRKG